MQITFLSDASSWKNPYLVEFAKELHRGGHRTVLLHDEKKVKRGDILFILGFFKIVPDRVLQSHRVSLVVHESGLPKGRGWSPVHWSVIEGAKAIPLTLFEAVQKVDAGQVFLRGSVPLEGSELMPELRVKVAHEMIRLCRKFVSGYPGILKKGTPQKGKATYYPRRGPANSRLDPKKSIVSQFNLLRVVDNDAYPAFFTHQGSTYVLKIEKKKN